VRPDVTLIGQTRGVPDEPRTRHQLRVWGWVTVVVTVVIAVIYLIVARPWSTYDGKKPSTKTHATSSWTGAARDVNLTEQI
jgi:Na+-driven multidrug efflux pump